MATTLEITTEPEEAMTATKAPEATDETESNPKAATAMSETTDMRGQTAMRGEKDPEVQEAVDQEAETDARVSNFMLD